MWKRKLEAVKFFRKKEAGRRSELGSIVFDFVRSWKRKQKYSTASISLVASAKHCKAAIFMVKQLCEQITKQQQSNFARAEK